MFEKTLTDVVKGIRSSKRDTVLYISQCIAEIKTEINSSDMHVKANALQKLTFLQLMGYSMSWASFASIEVMSSPRFAHKRIGYLAASQGFNQDTDVILLTTNLFKKELRGVGGGMSGVYEAGLAINGISNIVTEDLARDLLPELTNLTSHPQPYIRKKAVLCLFKLFVKYPQGLRLTFSKIQHCLQDSDASVVSCAVNVITELSDKNPKNYLHLAPAFFDLLTRSSNNWMLIKVVKLLGSLVPEEPRLARKLLEPLATIVSGTQAKSLLFEAVHTITLCLPYCRKNDGSMPAIVPKIVLLCAQTLRDLVEQKDQNLKYLGLVGFASLMQSHPRVLSAPDYRPLILACLSDQDVTIRSRALDLLTGMASRKNLMELVGQLLEHVEFATAQYKQDLVAKIIEMCSGDKYALLQDFEWYLDILFQLGHMRGVEKHGDLLRAQVMDVALRVLPVRPYAVRRSMEILLEGEGRASEDPYGDNGRGKHIAPDVLPAIAWIIGEYSDLIRQAIDDEEEEELMFDQESTGAYHSIIQALTSPTKCQKLAASTQKIFVQSAMKVLAAASADRQVKSSELEASVATLHRGFSVYMQSTDVEVVERSFTGLELLKSLDITSDSPGLIPVEDDSSDEGDLLGMDGGTKALKTSPAGPKSLASRLREASDVLCYALKPSPMKPIGAKAQRKKRDTITDIDLEKPVDMSLFQDLIDEETAYRESAKLTIDSVCFTQQQPLRANERPARSIADDFVSSAQSGMPSSHTAADSSVSFQHPPGSSSPAAPSTNRQREDDPFYLASAATTSDDGDREANRFGTIQLLDSDEEPERPKKDKKKKKDKRSKGDAHLQPTNDSSFFADTAPVEIIHSDDDDDGESPAAKPGKKIAQGEFVGLAQVDLTTPLREDEVMPERKHRVVPDRPPEPSKPAKSKKKSKKQKKSKAEKKASTDTVGDLLDLGGAFGSSDSAGPTPTASATPSTGPVHSNPINSAFDDLLGLDMSSAPVPPLPSAMSEASVFDQAPASKQPFTDTGGHIFEKSKTKPWMKASVKSKDLSLKYRISRSSSGLMAAFVISNLSSSPLSSGSLSFKNQQPIQIDALQPGASFETAKVGPFSLPSADDSLEVKGSFQTPEGKMSVKVVLPACASLSPEENLSIESVGMELASPGWSSHSSKVDLPSHIAPTDAKYLLRTFLHAAEVNEGVPNASTGTYACRSPTGARVRVLVKVKESTMKVDVKATSPTLAKAVASDAKRLLL